MTESRVNRLSPALSIFLAVTVAWVIGGKAAAQAPPGRGEKNDLLEQARQKEQVAIQKIESELREALSDAASLAASRPAKALEQYRKLRAALEEDLMLPDARREAWQRTIKNRIKALEGDVSRPDGKDKKPATIAALRAEEDRKAAQRDKDRVANALQIIKGLHAEERSAETLDQVEIARKLQKERERNVLGAFRDIDRSSTPAGADIEFPKDWKERTKNRSTAIKLTAKERALLKALNSEMTANFKNVKFDDVLEELRTRLDVNILVDPDALKDAEIAYDTPVSLNLRKTSARTVLRKLLGDLGLTYVIKDESINVVSAEKARDLMVVRGYYVADLLTSMGGISAPAPAANFPFAPTTVGGQPMQTAAQTIQNANALIELIKTSVDSQSWRDNGGTGTITFNAPTMSLIIKQSAEVHALLANGGLIK